MKLNETKWKRNQIIFCLKKNLIRLQKTSRKTKNSWTKSCSRIFWKNAQTNQTIRTNNRFAFQYRQIVIINSERVAIQNKQWSTIEFSRKNSNFFRNKKNINYNKYKNLCVKFRECQFRKTIQTKYHDFHQID